LENLLALSGDFMNIQEEQLAIKRKGYAEAMRYIANAKDTLKLAGQNGRYYSDSKYVQTACGTAYVGVLLAIEYFFKLKKVPLPEIGKSIKYYREGLKDYQKIKDALDSAYDFLHVIGYYKGCLDSNLIKIGFASAKEIIDQLKPEAAL
jgi:hypothetical protein